VSVVSRLLLTDSTMPMNFCEAGANCALAMLEHLGESLHMVTDVKEEIERKASGGSPALRRFLDEFPEERVHTLDLGLAASVAVAKKAIQLPGSHPDEDVGEIASVFYAVQRREEGETFDLVTDDSAGRKLARDRDLKVVTTPSLVIELVCAGALMYSDGDRVWRRCFSNPQRWKKYKERIKQECPSRVAA
jgi:hypothetical protein